MLLCGSCSVGKAGNEMHAARINRANLTKACLVALGLVVVALLMGAQPASGQQAADRQYSITDLGTLGGGFSEATAINNRGQVVGSFSVTASEGAPHAFLWEDGQMTALGTLPGGRFSGATAINSRGQVVGAGDSASGEEHAFLWSKQGP